MRKRFKSKKNSSYMFYNTYLYLSYFNDSVRFVSDNLNKIFYLNTDTKTQSERRLDQDPLSLFCCKYFYFLDKESKNLDL